MARVALDLNFAEQEIVPRVAMRRPSVGVKLPNNVFTREIANMLSKNMLMLISSVARSMFVVASMAL
jgi:hypothetical protein